MAEVFDKATGQVVNHPDDQVADAWQAGKVDLLPGARYQVKLQDGTYGTVPAEHMADALAAKAQIVSPEEAHQAQLHQQYGGMQGAGVAFDTGLLSQFTGGLSDQAMLGAAKALEATGARKAGYAKAFEESVQSTQEQHPIAEGVGETLGAVGLSAALPGGGLAGIGEKGAAYGAKAVGLGESAIGRVAQRAFVQGTREALAGTQYGIAKAISDDAFADHHLAAEQALATVGSSTLWGGALGAGFGALGGGIAEFRGSRALSSPEGRAAIESALTKGATDEDIATIAGRSMGVDQPATGLGGKIRSAYGKLLRAVGKDPDAVSAFVDGPMADANLEAALAAKETRDAAARQLRSDGDNLLRANEALTPDLMPGMKRDHIRRALADEVANVVGIDADAGISDAVAEARKPPIRIQEQLRDSEGHFIKGKAVRIDPNMSEGTVVGEGSIKISQPRAEQMTASARKLADDALSALYDMRDNPETFGSKKSIANTIKFADGLDAKLSRAIESGDIAEQYGLVDDLKRAIQLNAKTAGQVASGGRAAEYLTLAQNRAVAAKLADVQQSLRAGLEDESVWGQAARNQRAINSAWSSQIDASGRFERALTTGIGRNPNDVFGRELRGIDPEKAGTYTRGLLNPEKDLTHQAVLNYVDSTKRLADIANEVYDLSPEAKQAVADVGKYASSFRGSLDKATESLALANQFEHFSQTTSHGGTALGVVAGAASHGVLGGLTGLALGKVANLLTRPADTMIGLAAFNKFARESDGRIASALRSFGMGKARPHASPEISSYARKAAAVSRMMTNPDTLADRIGTNLGELRSNAPKLADAMTGASLRGLQILNAKLPALPPGDPFDPKRPVPQPPVAVRERWLRYYDAVQDPIGVVDDLRDGRLSPEGIEVLRTVYPKLYNRVQTQAYEMMAAGKLADLTKQQRIGLSMALGIATPETDPAYVAARQAAYSAPPDGPPPGGPPPRGRPVNITKAAPMLATDRIESGAAQAGR